MEDEHPTESHLIREIIDKHEYKGESLHSLSRKKLMKVVLLLLMYVPFLEVTLKKHKVEEIDTSIVK